MSLPHLINSKFVYVHFAKAEVVHPTFHNNLVEVCLSIQ